MDFNEQDAVWKLLEKAPPKRASGAFVSKVLREVRQLDDEPTPSRGWFWWSRWVVCGSAVAALVVTAALLLPRNAPDAAVAQKTEQADALAEELQVMTIVEELLAVNDPSQQLDDAGLAELLFFGETEF